MGERGARARSGAAVDERTGPVRRPEPNRDVAANRDLDGVAPVAGLRRRTSDDADETGPLRAPVVRRPPHCDVRRTVCLGGGEIGVLGKLGEGY